MTVRPLLKLTGWCEDRQRSFFEKVSSLCAHRRHKGCLHRQPTAFHNTRAVSFRTTQKQWLTPPTSRGNKTQQEAYKISPRRSRKRLKKPATSRSSTPEELQKLRHLSALGSTYPSPPAPPSPPPPRMPRRALRSRWVSPASQPLPPWTQPLPSLLLQLTPCGC